MNFYDLVIMMSSNSSGQRGNDGGRREGGGQGGTPPDEGGSTAPSGGSRETEQPRVVGGRDEQQGQHLFERIGDLGNITPRERIVNTRPMGERVANAVSSIPEVLNQRNRLIGMLVVFFLSISMGCFYSVVQYSGDELTRRNRNNLNYLDAMTQSPDETKALVEDDLISIYDWFETYGLLPSGLDRFTRDSSVIDITDRPNIHSIRNDFRCRINNHLCTEGVMVEFASFFHGDINSIVENAMAMGDSLNNSTFAVPETTDAPTMTFLLEIRRCMKNSNTATLTASEAGSGAARGAARGVARGASRGAARRAAGGAAGEAARGAARGAGRGGTTGIPMIPPSTPQTTGGKRNHDDLSPVTTGVSPPLAVRRSARENLSSRRLDRERGTNYSQINFTAGDIDRDTCNVKEAHNVAAPGSGADGSVRSDENDTISHSELLAMHKEKRINDQGLLGKGVYIVNSTQSKFLFGTIYRINGRNSLVMSRDARDTYGMRGTLTPHPACRFNRRNKNIQHACNDSCDKCGINGGCIICGGADENRQDIFVAICDWCHNAILKLFPDTVTYPVCAAPECGEMLGLSFGFEENSSAPTASGESSAGKLYCSKCSGVASSGNGSQAVSSGRARFSGLDEAQRGMRLTEFWTRLHGDDDIPLDFRVVHRRPASALADGVDLSLLRGDGDEIAGQNQNNVSGADLELPEETGGVAKVLENSSKKAGNSGGGNATAGISRALSISSDDSSALTLLLSSRCTTLASLPSSASGFTERTTVMSEANASGIGASPARTVRDDSVSMAGPSPFSTPTTSNAMAISPPFPSGRSSIESRHELDKSNIPPPVTPSGADSGAGMSISPQEAIAAVQSSIAGNDMSAGFPENGAGDLENTSNECGPDNQQGLLGFSWVDTNLNDCDTSDLAVAQKKLQECEESVLQNIKVHDKMVKSLKEALASNNELIASRYDAIIRLSDEIKDHGNALKEAKAEVDKLTSQEDTSHGDIDIDTIQETQQLEAASRQTALDAAKLKVRVIQSKIKELESDTEECEADISKYQNKIISLNLKIENAGKKHRKMEKCVEDARLELNRIQLEKKSEAIATRCAKLAEERARKEREEQESAARVAAEKEAAEKAAAAQAAAAKAAAAKAAAEKENARKAENSRLIEELDSHSDTVLLALDSIVRSGEMLRGESRRVFGHEPSVNSAMDTLDIIDRYRRHIAQGRENVAELVRVLHESTNRFLESFDARNVLLDSFVNTGPPLSTAAAASGGAAADGDETSDGENDSSPNDDSVRDRDFAALRKRSESNPSGSVGKEDEVSDDECNYESFDDFKEMIEVCGSAGIGQYGLDPGADDYLQRLSDMFQRGFLADCRRAQRRACIEAIRAREANGAIAGNAQVATTTADAARTTDSGDSGVPNVTVPTPTGAAAAAVPGPSRSDDSDGHGASPILGLQAGVSPSRRQNRDSNSDCNGGGGGSGGSRG